MTRYSFLTLIVLMIALHACGSDRSNPNPTDELQKYVQACDQVIAASVPDFSCNVGTEVPITNYDEFASHNCDRPNRLHGVCDPGSHFQVLANKPDGVVVAHCRKQGLSDGQYGDIAIIQFNPQSGAACFYQALGDLSGQVKAPAKGLGAWQWLSPARTAKIGCVSCHDNGPLIRSPYITQEMGANTMPGASDFSFNRNQPYYFVGDDFASWEPIISREIKAPRSISVFWQQDQMDRRLTKTSTHRCHPSGCPQALFSSIKQMRTQPKPFMIVLCIASIIHYRIRQTARLPSLLGILLRSSFRHLRFSAIFLEDR